MTAEEVRRLIAGGESLTVEFKSDATRLPDAEWIETVVCMANHQGGILMVGVEDDGTVTGLHPYHQTSPQPVAAFIASRTVPPLTVEVSFINLPGGMVAVVSIPAARQPVSTSDGKLLIRYFDTKGKPGCRPLYSHEIIGWRADRGMADLSALPIPEATWADLDTVEFARLRRMVEENRGDTVLLNLTDEGIANALGLVSNQDGKAMITLAGLLLVAPHPRNPLLADAFKRIGLVEKTGRGVGIIYTGQLQNGRLRPIYDRSTQVSVTVTLDTSPADLKLVESLIQANKRLGRALNVNELLILNEAWRERRLDMAYAAKLIQLTDEAEVRTVLEQLVKVGILKARGERQQRVYHFVGAVSRKARESASVENAQIEQMLLHYVKEHGKITRREAAELCQISQRQATYLLNKFLERGALRLEGHGRGTKYILPN